MLDPWIIEQIRRREEEERRRREERPSLEIPLERPGDADRERERDRDGGRKGPERGVIILNYSL